ncbi:hypothetical protein [Pinibacter aurantiacus]|uniref:Uncharacterized protein n=1 Tax=Pinibacter aurantiacus TaxID=2851599 RepID=A0A9E2SC02_9BACT|nr:hypothetical protein [Pinibacter aurantiacus]MBV4358537.1 hypothetical protein [Pinibacter aurantiacus]
MDTNSNMEERLWDYVDGISSAHERSVIDKLLETDSAWRHRYKEILKANILLQESIELDEPSMRFTQNVMEDIAKYKIAPAASTYINKKIIYGIATVFITIIVAMFVYVFANVNWASAGAGGGMPFDISKINYGKIFSSTYVNIFLMLNVMIGLVLFDKYLSVKKKKLLAQDSTNTAI